MKRKALLAAIALLACLLTIGVGADQPTRKVMNFIAVLDLRCGEGVDKSITAPLTNVVIEELVKIKKYTVIDRANRDKILGELGFQQTACLNDSCTVEVGRMLGVGKIVVGSIDKIGETYMVNLQLINVETAAIENMSRSTCKKCELDNLIETVASVARKLMGEEAQPVTPVAPPPAPASPSPTSPPSVSRYSDMALVPAGEFMMGCNPDVDTGCPIDEKPYHKVYLDAFYIDKYEATVNQYTTCVQEGKCSKPKTIGLMGDCNWGDPQRGQHPMNCIGWEQAKVFCEWAGKRLPTEAEWEKAARGTDGRIYPWGNDTPNCSLAIMDDGGPGCRQKSTWPVGSKPNGVSPYGVFDMAGNVWEWTADSYQADYYLYSPAQNPKGPPENKLKVLRGGGWPYKAYDLRVTRRHWSKQDEGSTRRGVRCVKAQ